jgi:hypothetical protein
MDFLEDYSKLEPSQKDRLQHVITRLLAGEVLTPGSLLKIDPDWRFAERFRDLIDSYLRIGGWRLEIELGLRIARAVHETGAQRVRFSKLESLLLCALRLYHHEQMRTASEDEQCELSVSLLRERLIHAGKPAGQLSSRALAPAVRRLARHSLVQIGKGFEAQDQEVLVVMPLIERLLPPDRIQEIEEKIKAYTVSRTAESAESNSEVEAETADENPEEESA